MGFCFGGIELLHASTELPLSSIPRLQIVLARLHAVQRGRMLKSQNPLPRLQDLHKQLLGLLLPALIPVCCCKVSHAVDRVWMLKSLHPGTRLQGLHKQLFGLLRPALVPVCRCKVSHSDQYVFKRFTIPLAFCVTESTKPRE